LAVSGEQIIGQLLVLSLVIFLHDSEWPRWLAGQAPQKRSLTCVGTEEEFVRGQHFVIFININNIAPF